MDPYLFRYIWQNSKRSQLAILVLVVCSLPFYFFSLNLPKQIVNEGIQGKGFSGPGSTQLFGRIFLPFGDSIFGHPVLIFPGVPLEQPGYLLALSFLFLALVLVNISFKARINTEKGRLGERMLRRLRFQLADRLLRFHLPTLRRMKAPEVATMIKDEVEPLGGFIGDAIVTPAFQGGMALTAMFFILSQSVILGSVAIAIVLVQAALIPRLRIRILALGRQRQLTARQLSGRIGEIMDGAIEVHANDATNWERAELTRRLGKIFGIRFEIYQRKFFVKGLNNFLSQLTPFIFYSVGGWLALQGRLDIGALVAVINAYKDLPAPIRELINWEQQRNDVQIKYEQVAEQFQPTAMWDSTRQDPDAPVQPLTGRLAASGLCFEVDGIGRVLDGLSFDVPVESHVAVVGDGHSGKEHLGLLVAAILHPSGGSLTFNGVEATNLPEAVTGRRIGYVDHDAYFFPLSIRDNLLYGLRHRPIRPAEMDSEREALHRRLLHESARAGNSLLDLEADWIDYEAAGVATADELTDRVLHLLALVGLEGDIYRFGLAGKLDPVAREALGERFLEARRSLAGYLEESGEDDLVIRFHPDHYNLNASLAENLLFGTALAPDFEAGALAGNLLVLDVLSREQLEGPLLEMGLRLAETLVEIFADLPPGHPFFEQFSMINADDVPLLRQTLLRVGQRDAASLPADERQRLLRLAFAYVEARHRLGLIDDTMAQRVIAVRPKLAAAIEGARPGAVEFYDPDRYNTAASLLDNLLFGRLVYGRAEAQEKVMAAVGAVLQRLGLERDVKVLGIEFPVGVGGKRLSAAQRQRLAFVRALLKRPDLLVVNQGTAALDGAARAEIIRRTLEERQGTGVFWILERASFAELFEQVLVLRAGQLAESGAYKDLMEREGELARLLAAD